MSESVRGRFQIDWLVSNLRWLLLVSVALVSLTDTYIKLGSVFDSGSMPPQILILTLAILYNLVVMLLLLYGALPRAFPVLTLLVDTGLTIGFVVASGGLQSPLLFFGLFPILTAALRHRWAVSLLIAVIIVLGCGLAGYRIASPETLSSHMYPYAARSLILVLAALFSGLVGDRVKRTVERTRRREEEAALRKLRTAHEHSRIIFELASMLSATLNYTKVLDAMLEVAEAGLRELDRPDLAHLSMVLLFSSSDLRIAASRHLPHRDQHVRFPGKGGILGRALTTAVAAATDEPASDPELRQLISMHNCQQAVAVPLRAGFENFGAIVVACPQPDAYSEDHLDLLTAICNQGIVALQNAQLYQNLMREKEHIVAVEEAERKKLSRRLHDGPTQTIASIAMRLNYIQMLLHKEPSQVPDELAHVEDLARQTTAEIRQLLFTLRPLILETQGLRAALEQYISKLSDTEATAMRLEASPGVDDVLDHNTQGVTFYIIEEAIGNARKHAEARNIWVRLYVQNGTFVAEVEDDGVGFDVDDVQSRYDQRGSLGMINMHERAEMINGRLSITSAPGRGAQVRVALPVKRK